ncbi:KAP family NTPase [Allomuricauda sp. SCSIO 65647]|uniref:KAP family NTPase n=1 Tax=Allomuricauda sp. SCSIO 65647 TaxID=2908843 RepID=UPI001F1CE455|nr:KAP family NTPase [Muricauda sp. SCSIO 65647]UJH66424.1 KAP family NTPase [Muricauda sp. SCSIO 65647]
MKKFRSPKFNLKYILGEIILLFVGINLAIWFNNWNNSKTIDKNKTVAIQKIREEIESNLDELIEARDQNGRIPDFIEKYDALSSENGDYILMSADEMVSFKEEYSQFYKVIDSTAADHNRFLYKGSTFIHLRMPELSKIAWETSKATGIFNEFGFDCLYELESMYNLQGLVEKEINNAFTALQEESIERLLRILVFIDQLDKQLEDDYREMLKSLDNCG